MPGVGLIPEYDERLKVAGVAITPDEFLQRGIFPLLKALGTSRRELIAALQKRRAAEALLTSEADPAAVEAEPVGVTS